MPSGRRNYCVPQLKRLGYANRLVKLTSRISSCRADLADQASSAKQAEGPAKQAKKAQRTEVDET